VSLILGIETSCDETAAAIFDNNKKKLVSSYVYSQVSLHKKYGGVVPEIASRSHLEKIGPIVRSALEEARVTIDDIDHIAVTNKPGLAGALLIGLSYAKGLAWANGKNLIKVDHLEGHIFSSFLDEDGFMRKDIEFPHLSLVVSGGHTSIFLVKDFGSYEMVGRTLDDAAGEAFDKVAKLLGLGYPGGPRIEKLACSVNFKDFHNYPRTKHLRKTLDFSFSGLKTAVLYDLVSRGAYDLNSGIIENNLTQDLQKRVSSSLLVCITDILIAKVETALKKYPEAKVITCAGGVACNSYLRQALKGLSEKRGKKCVIPPSKYCADNAAMVAFVGGYKGERREFEKLSLDVYE
jgi:N6-L-threonylcarbamoyladenine synthase